MLVGHTPLDRPASGRVLRKAAFVAVGEVDDEHDGQPLHVIEWRLRLTASRDTSEPGSPLS